MHCPSQHPLVGIGPILCRWQRYEALQRCVWDDQDGAKPETVRNVVRKLRRKLGDDARNPKYILSERGFGYRMSEPDQP